MGRGTAIITKANCCIRGELEAAYSFCLFVPVESLQSKFSVLVAIRKGSVWERHGRPCQCRDIIAVSPGSHAVASRSRQPE